MVAGVSVTVLTPLCLPGCGSSSAKKKVPTDYHPDASAGEAGESASGGGAGKAQAGAGGSGLTGGDTGLAGRVDEGGAGGESGALAEAGAAGATVSGCALGDPCCAGSVCESQLECLGAVCSCVADLTGEYLLRTDGVAFYTAINSTSQSVVVNADTGMPLHGIKTLSGSRYHGCAALDTGEARCWPLVSDSTGNNSGQLGNGSIGGLNATLGATLVKTSATTNLADVVAIGADSTTYFAATTTCAVQGSGALYCWGSGFGHVVNAATAATPFATLINVASVGPALAGVTQVALGYAHACALTNGKVRCWGENDGTGASTAYPSADVTGLAGTITKIGAGYAYSCALSSANGSSVYCWGDNSGAKLGIGDPAAVGYNSAYPVRVRTSANTYLDSVADLVITSAGACALRTDHSVWCWGSTINYATAVKQAGVTVSNAVKISAPFDSAAPRWLTETGVLFSQNNMLTPNCTPQD